MANCDTFKVECYMTPEVKFKEIIKGKEDQIDWTRMASDGIIPTSCIIMAVEDYGVDINVFPKKDITLQLYIDFKEKFNFSGENKNLYLNIDWEMINNLYQKNLIDLDTVMKILQYKPIPFHNDTIINLPMILDLMSNDLAFGDAISMYMNDYSSVWNRNMSQPYSHDKLPEIFQPNFLMAIMESYETWGKNTGSERIISNYFSYFFNYVIHCYMYNITPMYKLMKIYDMIRISDLSYDIKDTATFKGLSIIRQRETELVAAGFTYSDDFKDFLSVLPLKNLEKIERSVELLSEPDFKKYLKALMFKRYWNEVFENIKDFFYFWKEAKLN